MTPLVIIFDRFYALVKDTDLEKLADEDLYRLTLEWYFFAASRFKECKKNLDLVEVDGETFVKDELSQEEISILAIGILCHWMHLKIDYNELMKKQVNTSDFTQLSNANLLLRLNELFAEYESKFFKLRKAYTRNYPDDFAGWN